MDDDEEVHGSSSASTRRGRHDRSRWALEPRELELMRIGRQAVALSCCPASRREGKRAGRTKSVKQR